MGIQSRKIQHFLYDVKETVERKMVVVIQDDIYFNTNIHIILNQGQNSKAFKLSPFR